MIGKPLKLLLLELESDNQLKINPRGKYKYLKAGLDKEIAEHRQVMHLVDPRDNENELVVHHIDGDKSNNNPANLTWMHRSDHARLHRLGENHFPCDGENNANYRHGMCVGGHSKEYVHIKNQESYQRHRIDRLSKQNAYGAEHREHKRWYDKMKYWQNELTIAETEERRKECSYKINCLKENPI